MGAEVLEVEQLVPLVCTGLIKFDLGSESSSVGSKTMTGKIAKVFIASI